MRTIYEARGHWDMADLSVQAGKNSPRESTIRLRPPSSYRGIWKRHGGASARRESEH